MTGPDPHDVQILVRGIARHYRHARFVLLSFAVGVEASRVREMLGAVGEPSAMADHSRAPALEMVRAVAFTFEGLKALGLSADSLDSFPVPFRQGMRARSGLLGDDQHTWEEHWGSVHAIVLLAGEEDDLDDEIGRLEDLCLGTARARTKRRKEPPPPATMVVQQCERRFKDWPDGTSTMVEPFGFTDGLSSIAVAGITDLPAKRLPGNGAFAKGRWRALATGELLLGHVDEAGDVPDGPQPENLAHNGTFLVYRKLEQHVASFEKHLSAWSKDLGMDEETIAAHMVGRDRKGTPLVDLGGTGGGNDFLYDTEEGAACPLGAHIRRANPRDTSGFDTILVDRHRIARRSFPYGEDDAEGLIFVALNTDIARQFEFIQQEWIERGNDSDQGDDRDPLVGNHGTTGRFVFRRPDDRSRSVVISNIPSFVTSRGGEYCFVPSLSAWQGLVSGRWS